MNNAKRERADWLRKQAVEFLKNHGVIFQEMTPYHIKIGSVNFYPAKGTICFDDGEKAIPEKGLEALLTTIRKIEPLFIKKAPENENRTIIINTVETIGLE